MEKQIISNKFFKKISYYRARKKGKFIRSTECFWPFLFSTHMFYSFYCIFKEPLLTKNYRIWRMTSESKSFIIWGDCITSNYLAHSGQVHKSSARPLGFHSQPGRFGAFLCPLPLFHQHGVVGKIMWVITWKNMRLLLVYYKCYIKLVLLFIHL